MKTTHLSLSLIAVFAAACASSPDRARAQRAEHDHSAARAGDHQKTGTTTHSERPLMIVGGRKVELVGHTDPRGDDEYNRQLGRSRADSVRDFLQSKGVAEDKLVMRSMGEHATAQDDPSAWPLDRRVDIRLLPE